MVALYWIVRVLKYWLIAWVLMTWIPGLAGSDFHLTLGLPVMWMLIPFQFLNLGAVSLAPIIPVFLLNVLETYLGKQAGLVSTGAAPVQPDGVVDVRDLRPATPPDNSPNNNVGI